MPAFPVVSGRLSTGPVFVQGDAERSRPVAGNSAEPGRSVASKVTSILLTFTEGKEHTLSDIARSAGLPISTAHRLASELTSRRMLERTPQGGYRAGLTLRLIGTNEDGGGSGHRGMTQRAPYVLEDLATATRTRARLGVLSDLQVAYIEKVPGRKPATSFSMAATLPAHPTALGRALLAFSPADAVEMTIINGLRSYTGHTVTSPDLFRRALAITRLTGVAVTRFELENNFCGVAVPVFGPGGNVVAALEVAVRDPDHGPRRVLAALAIASRSLSREIGSAGGHRPAGIGGRSVGHLPIPVNK